MKKKKIYLKSLAKRAKNNFPKIYSEEFLGDFSIRALGIVGLVLLAGTWIYSLVRFSPTDYVVPLRYNSFLGVTELGGWYKLYFIPFLLLLVSFLNSFLANTVFNKDKMISYILMGTSIFVTVCGLAVIINLSIIINR